MYQVHLCQSRHNRVGRTVEAEFASVRGLVLSLCFPYTLLDIIDGIDIQGTLDRKNFVTIIRECTPKLALLRHCLRDLVSATYPGEKKDAAIMD